MEQLQVQAILEQRKREEDTRYDEFRHTLVDVFYDLLQANKDKPDKPSTLYMLDKMSGCSQPQLYKIFKPRKERNLQGFGLKVLFRLMEGFQLSLLDVAKTIEKRRK